MVGGESTVNKVAMEEIEGPEVFEFSAVFHGGGEDCVAVVDVAYKDVFIALTGCRGELPSEVRCNFMFG